MANIRKIRAWLLLGSLYAYLIVQALFVLNFYHNRDYYIAEVCVQKENPKNCCQASCVLEKQLQLPEKTDTQSPQWLIGLPEFILADLYHKDPIEHYLFDFCDFLIPKTVNQFILPIERPPTISKILFT